VNFFETQHIAVNNILSIPQSRQLSGSQKEL